VKKICSYALGDAEARVYTGTPVPGTYLVRLYLNDQLYPAADYETYDLSDAKGTAQALVAGYQPGPAKLTFDQWLAANAAHIHSTGTVEHWLRCAWDAAINAGR
jgi:hypothetical protein